MAGAWLRESLLRVAWERPAGGFEAFEGGQAAGSNVLKPVGGFEALEGGQTAGSNVLVAWQRPAGGFEVLEGLERP